MDAVPRMTLIAIAIAIAASAGPAAAQLGVPIVEPAALDEAVADGVVLRFPHRRTAKDPIACIEWGTARPYVTPRSEWRRCRARRSGLGG